VGRAQDGARPAPDGAAAAPAGGTERRVTYVLNPKDNVATALRDLAAGERVVAVRDAAAGPAGTIEVVLRQSIAFGHKLALVPIARGEPVLKYGEAIGLAGQDIAPGEHVHTHNVESQRGRGDLAARPAT
jgi:altronate dehydratase small subunit